MRLNNVKLVHEDDKAYHLHDGKNQFAVAKKGLKKETLDRIAKHFAKGGQVKGYDEGGDVPEEQYDPRAWMAGMTQPQPAPLPPPLPPPPAPAVPSADPEGDEASAYIQGIEGGDHGPNGLPVMPAKSAAEEKTGGGLTAEQKLAAQQAATAGQASPGAPGTTVPQMNLPELPKVPQFGAGPDFDKEMDQAGKEQQQANLDVAKAQQAQNSALLAARKPIDDQYQKDVADIQGRAKFAQDNSDAMANEIRNYQIDPNRIFHNMSTGQKVMTTLSILLSGIGSGMTHTNNAALGVINNAIDRDIDAQKAELGKKHTMLEAYMRQGHDARSAEEMTRAHFRDAISDLRQRMAEETGNPLLAAQARQKNAADRQENALRRSTIANAQMERRAKMYELQLQGVNAEMQRQQLMRQANMQAMAMPIETRLNGGLGVGAENANIINPETDRMMEDGLYYRANSKEDNTKLGDSMAVFSKLRGEIGEAKALRAKNKGGTYNREDSNLGADIRARIQDSLAESSKKMKEGQALKELSDLVPDPSEHSPLGNIDAKLNALERRINAAWAAEKMARLRARGGISSTTLQTKKATQ